MNSLPGSNFQYLVTIHIDSIQMTPNTINPISQLPNCKGRLLALPTNISLGWKWMEAGNTLAYYGAATITSVKKFMKYRPMVVF